MKFIRHKRVQVDAPDYPKADWTNPKTKFKGKDEEQNGKSEMCKGWGKGFSQEQINHGLQKKK